VGYRRRSVKYRRSVTNDWSHSILSYM